MENAGPVLDIERWLNTCELLFRMFVERGLKAGEGTADSPLDRASHTSLPSEAIYLLV